MTALLNKILPISPSKTQENEDEDEYNVEYSFAVEYEGPPLSYCIPILVPVDVNKIPEASIVSKRSIITNLSPPVIHPIVKNQPLRQLGFKYSGELVGVQGMSSGSLEFFDTKENSRALSGTSEIEDLNEEGLMSDDNVSDYYEFEEENCVDEGSNSVKKPSIVTFHEPESSEEVILATISRRPEIKNLKKGSCYHCFKKIRFSAKEICIVCNAKYCINCIIRAMGSMPEGRKCLTCISYAIDESRRGILGKPSRLLKELFTDIEIKNIMESEMFCEVNRLPPTLVYVNEKPLCRKEFSILQNCLNPPKKIEPGRYWYDKTAGFWGKEGQKPCQIISPELAVGGEILRNCSNGRTNVVINKREITKAEHRVLQWAGIRCEGYPSFWLGADGSLQEEGMNNVIAKIWDKVSFSVILTGKKLEALGWTNSAISQTSNDPDFLFKTTAKTGIHLVCSLLSLPIPPQRADPMKNKIESASNGDLSNNLDQEILYKLLLVGSDQSGTSTIFKQARMVHNVRFTDEERENFKIIIQSSLYTYLGIILEGREQFEEENILETSENPQTHKEKCVYYLNQRLRVFSDWLIQVMISGKLEVIFPASSREFAPQVLELLKDKAFQAAYNWMNELNCVPPVAKYILNRANDILKMDYEPSDTDILCIDGITSSNNLASMEFSFQRPAQDGFTDPAEVKDLILRKYQLTRIHSSSLGQNCKWLQMFEDTDLVLFTVSLTDYDQFTPDKNGFSTNKMLESKKLFENIVTHPFFYHKNFLLILNKFDLLEEKIEQAPLSLCEWFSDFDPVMGHHPRSDMSVSSNPSLAQRGFQYIGMKFKGLFHSFLTGKKLYVSKVNALESKSVDVALSYAREILNWEEQKPSFIAQDTSSFSNEASTSG